MIQIENINKAFGDNIIFQNFSLQINKGEFVGIFGKSGKGKTTLLNMIGTLEKYDAGKIKICGKTINNKKNKVILLRNDIGFIFQNYALVDNETVKFNLEIALKHKKIDKNEKKERIRNVLETVKLEKFEEKKIHTLSGGEQQRIAIARLLLKDPQIILADEPTGSLDEENKNIIVKLFKELHSRGKTIIVVSHDKELVPIFSRVINL